MWDIDITTEIRAAPEVTTEFPLTEEQAEDLLLSDLKVHIHTISKEEDQKKFEIKQTVIRCSTVSLTTM